MQFKDCSSINEVPRLTPELLSGTIKDYYKLRPIVHNKKVQKNKLLFTHFHRQQLLGR